MTATAHALVGTLIAGRVGDPIVASALSFASHFVLDIIPHWDTGTHYRTKSNEKLFWGSAVDVSASFVSSIILYFLILKQDNFSLLFLSVFFAQLPDWLTAPYFIFHIKHPFWKIFYNIQHVLNSKLDKPLGIITQIVSVLILYFLLYKIF